MNVTMKISLAPRAGDIILDGTKMTVNEFLNWWAGFTAAIDPEQITPELWKIACDKIAQINHYQLPSVFFPTPVKEPIVEPEQKRWPEYRPWEFPRQTDRQVLPYQPHIWCGNGIKNGTIPSDYVGTPKETTYVQ